MKKLLVSLSMIGLAVALSGPSASASGTTAQRIAVRYGTGDLWTSEQFLIGNRYICSNLAFKDPAPHLKKACFIDNKKVADEGEYFTTPAPECGREHVKYISASGKEVIREFCPGRKVTCSNAVFGTDPAVGSVKHCEWNQKYLANENQTFDTAPELNCLCSGKTLGQLAQETPVIKDATHD